MYTVSHLEDIGLVRFPPMIAGYFLTGLPQNVRYHYHEIPINVAFPSSDVNINKLDTGMVVLTSIGRELAPICDSKRIPGFLEYVLERWTANGLVVSSPYPQQGNYPNE